MAKKILVVDDEVDIQRIVAFRLEKGGYQVFSAYNGLEGLEIAAREKPDLILLDLRMPKMSGEEACQKLKADPALKAIPIIFLTASQFVHTEELVKTCGADDLLIKPFTPEDLLAKISKYLK